MPVPVDYIEDRRPSKFIDEDDSHVLIEDGLALKPITLPAKIKTEIECKVGPVIVDKLMGAQYSREEFLEEISTIGERILQDIVTQHVEFDKLFQVSYKKNIIIIK